jgi:hypothetical protein
METRNVKISLETAQRWYNGTDNELKELAVQTYPEIAKKELPKSWCDLGKISGWKICTNTDLNVTSNYPTDFDSNANIFATKEQAEASIAMAQLSQLMKVYNDGWVPDWTDIEYKYCIGFTNEKLCIDNWYNYKQFLSFKDRETAELFIQNFRELIETAKPLL